MVIMDRRRIFSVEEIETIKKQLDEKGKTIYNVQLKSKHPFLHLYSKSLQNELDMKTRQIVIIRYKKNPFTKAFLNWLPSKQLTKYEICVFMI